MVGLRKSAKALAAVVRACANMLVTAGLDLAGIATNLEKFAASK